MANKNCPKGREFDRSVCQQKIQWVFETSLEFSSILSGAGSLHFAMSSEKEIELAAQLEAAQKEIAGLKEENGILRNTCGILRKAIDESFEELQKLRKEKEELTAKVAELSKHE